MKQKFLIRLDDACPTLDKSKWSRMEALLDYYGIKPMVGIVPNCQDENLVFQDKNLLFWDEALEWQSKGWVVALHGYDHCYLTKDAGINPMWNRSEFAGLPLESQKEKIKLGVAIMREHGLNPQFFFAPSHTFDDNTLIALREESDIRIISDTIARYPYKKGDFYFIPQIVGHCVKMPMNGLYTFCFHPNTMDDKAFSNLESFLKQYENDFITFDNINLQKCGNKSLFDTILSILFFAYRSVRGLK